MKWRKAKIIEMFDSGVCRVKPYNTEQRLLDVAIEGDILHYRTEEQEEEDSEFEVVEYSYRGRFYVEWEKPSQ